MKTIRLSILARLKQFKANQQFLIGIVHFLETHSTILDNYS
jgi:hypothetical protein